MKPDSCEQVFEPANGTSTLKGFESRLRNIPEARQPLARPVYPPIVPSQCQLAHQPDVIAATPAAISAVPIMRRTP
jgi:hypothetical protein